MSLKVPLGRVAFLSLIGDALRIRTSGTHDYYPSLPEEPAHETWDHGVDVWSDQYSLTLALEVPFSGLWQ